MNTLIVDSYSYYMIQIFIAHKSWDCRNNKDIHFESYFLIVIAQFQPKIFFEITCFINNNKQTPLFLVDHLEKTFLAFLTRKCFLSRMSSKVSLVIVWKGKWLRTLLTGKGFLSSISSFKCSYLETFMTWHEMTWQRLGKMFARNLFLFSRSMASLMGFCN